MFRVFCVLSLLWLMAACRQPAAESSDNINIAVSVADEALAVGEATLIITLTDANGAPINDASLEVRGDMNHAGMQPVLRSAQDGEAGIYRVPFEWTMGGDWFVEVTATRSNGESATARFDFSIRP